MEEAAAEALLNGVNWEPVVELAGTAVSSCAVVGTVAYHARRLLAVNFDPRAAIAQGAMQQLPSALERAAHHVQHVQRTARDALEHHLPVDAQRARLSEKGIATAVKVALWDEIVYLRLTALVALPVLHAAIVNVVAIEAVLGLVAQARDSRSSYDGNSFFANAMIAQMMSRFGGGAGAGAPGAPVSTMGQERLVAPRALSAIFEAARSCLKQFVPEGLKCSGRLPHATLSATLRRATGALLDELVWADLLLPEEASDATVADGLLADVVAHESFDALVRDLAETALEERVIAQLGEVVYPKCASYVAEPTDAVAVHIVSGVTSTLYGVVDGEVAVPRLTGLFCESLLSSNVGA
jgi:hypothetical protein